MTRIHIKVFRFINNAIEWIHERTNEKQFLIFSSIVVGISSGIAAVILKLFVFFIREYLVVKYLLKIDYKYLYLLLPAMGIGITVFISRTFFRDQINKGASAILYAIAKKSSFLPFHQMYSHVITSGITVGFGGSAGLESPIISTGSAIGSNFAKKFRLSYKDRTLLLAAGAAGGIAGAFNAPIAGVLFALEVILIDISIGSFIPLLIAAASGALISKIALEESVLLFFKLKQPFDYINVPLYVLLGLLAGFTSLYYINFFDKVDATFSRIKHVNSRWIIGGISLALLYGLFPSLFGEGYDSIKLLAESRPGALFKDSFLPVNPGRSWLLLLLISSTMMLKAVAAGITLGSGGNGGNFAPSLFVGAYLGFAFSFFLSLIGFDHIPQSNFTIVAMAGILSGVFHAPLTAIFLIAEITGGYELIIPLMIVSTISYAISRYKQPDSLDVRRTREKGVALSSNKDENLLGKINIQQMIEKDFTPIHFSATLREMIEIIKHSNRNIFPVVKKNDSLLGMIYLNSIREEMFKPELYDRITAHELMYRPVAVVDEKDDIFSIMKKFEKSGQWDLPVTRDGQFIGFLSKSVILDEYRKKLLDYV